jgi:hypothetical protein
MNQHPQWSPPQYGQPPGTQYGWTPIPNSIPPQQQFQQPPSPPNIQRSPRQLFQNPRYLILFIVIGALLIASLIGGISFWVFTQLPPPLSWLETDNSTVIFIHWADANGTLSGQMQIVGVDSNYHIQQYNEPFTGTYDSQDHSISLTIHPLIIFTYTLTGTVSWNTLTLEGSGSNGSLSKVILHPGSIDDFNQAVSNLEQHINQQVQNAEATASVMQATATAQAQNADATASVMQATATTQVQQQQAVSDANNALGPAIQQLNSDTNSLANDTDFNDVMQSYADHWSKMQADYQKEQTDANGGCSQFYTVQSDDYTVQSDGYSIQSDDYSFQSRQYPFNTDLSQVQNEMHTVQTDWQQLQLAVTTNTTGSPAPAFSADDVNKTLQAAQKQVDDSQSALNQAQSQASTYDNEAKQLVQSADALVANTHC